jgi:hypothetical protein
MEGGGDLLPSVRSVFDRSVGIGPAAGYVHLCVNNPSVSGGLRQETADKRGQGCDMVWNSVRKCESVWNSVEYLSNACHANPPPRSSTGQNGLIT